ncbi:MAG: hypothetical protein WCY29_10915 [Novosphingobium sp.]
MAQGEARLLPALYRAFTTPVYPGGMRPGVMPGRMDLMHSLPSFPGFAAGGFVRDPVFMRLPGVGKKGWRKNFEVGLKILDVSKTTENQGCQGGLPLLSRLRMGEI